jgi:hypothetical protein
MANKLWKHGVINDSSAIGLIFTTKGNSNVATLICRRVYTMFQMCHV